MNEKIKVLSNNIKIYKIEMENNQLEISIVKFDKKPSLLNTKLQKTNLKLKIVNKSTSLTEIIIQKNIQFKDLQFKIVLTQFEEISTVIKSNYLQTLYPNQKTKDSYISYTSRDFTIELNDLLFNYIYKVNVSLVEKIPNTTIENEMLHSNTLVFNPLFGIVTQKLIEKLYKDKYKPKKYLSKSEKDNAKSVANEMKLRELDNLLNEKDIKTFTYEGRTYDNIKQFVNSKYKASKLMTEKRKKKVLFSTHSDMYFSHKMDTNEEKENPFMKNSWFMGPIYSYDYNYDKYI